MSKSSTDLKGGWKGLLDMAFIPPTHKDNGSVGGGRVKKRYLENPMCVCVCGDVHVHKRTCTCKTYMYIRTLGRLRSRG